MKNYLKLLISLFSTSAIISCGTQKSTETTTTTETTKPTEETSGGGEGGGVTPNAGGWPSLDKLPISGSLGASKTSFFNDRAMESRFNAWKEKKDDFAKAIYATSSQGQSDLEDYYNGSKDDWFTSNASDTAYNTWRAGSGKTALATTWKTTSDYSTKSGEYIAGGSSTKRSKATWLGLAASDANYNTWRAKRTNNLKSAWEATTAGATSYTTKFNAYKTGHATDTKEKYADLAASNNDYNTWRIKRETALKNAWEATTAGATSYTTKFNAYKSSHATDTKEKYADLAASNNDYNTWRVKREAALKTAWEATSDFTSKAKRANDTTDYALADKTNISSFLDSKKNDNQRIGTININISTGTHRGLKVVSAGSLENQAFLTFINNVNSGAYRNGGREWTNFDVDSAGYAAAWTSLINAYNAGALIAGWQADVLSFYEVILAAGVVDSDYNTWAINRYKAATATYNTNLDAWSATKANGLATYKLSADLTSDYATWIEAQYKASTTYNTDLDAWSATKANGLATYKLSADLTSDYATWIAAQYKASTTYNTDLDAWSTTKANGQSAYNAHADSTTDYNAWTDPNHRTTATYDANHLGHFDRDLGLWSATKANGKTTFFADDASDTAFNSYVNPNPNKVNEYIQSSEFTTNFNNFVTSNLTWAAYKDFFIKQKYNSEAFKKIYYNYLLDQ